MCLSFPEENFVYVDENQGFVTVCLTLTNVVQSTMTQIWADIISVDGTAMGNLFYWETAQMNPDSQCEPSIITCIQDILCCWQQDYILLHFELLSLADLLILVKIKNLAAIELSYSYQFTKILKQSTR